MPRKSMVRPEPENINYLLSLSLVRERVASMDAYPYTIPAIAGLTHMRFDHPVTFLVGENGAGKSTLLEAIAVAWGLNPEGGSMNFDFATRESHSGLAGALRLSRGMRRPGDSFFLRAESYFNVATEIEALDQEASFGRKIIDSFGGKSLHEQ